MGEKMGAFMSVFNGHSNNADSKARTFLKEFFPIYLEEVEKVEQVKNGIMGIFDEKPTPATAVYAALVTYFVNQPTKEK